MWGRKVRKYRFLWFILILCLSLYDYQAKASRFRRGLTYLKKKGNHKSKPNITFTKTENIYFILKYKINGNHPTKKRKEKHRVNWKTRLKMAINKSLSITPLNVNGLNAPIKRHRVAHWIKKQKPSIRCLPETHLRAKDT